MRAQSNTHTRKLKWREDVFVYEVTRHWQNLMKGPYADQFNAARMSDAIALHNADFKHFENSPNEPKPWFFLPLVALDTVKVAETKVLSPVAFARTFQDATVASKILFDKPAPSEDVLKLAARQGLKMMNAHWLEKLYCHLKI